jgi:hypothetical protein
LSSVPRLRRSYAALRLPALRRSKAPVTLASRPTRYPTPYEGESRASQFSGSSSSSAPVRNHPAFGCSAFLRLGPRRCFRLRVTGDLGHPVRRVFGALFPPAQPLACLRIAIVPAQGSLPGRLAVALPGRVSHPLDDYPRFKSSHLPSSRTSLHWSHPAPAPASAADRVRCARRFEAEENLRKLDRLASGEVINTQPLQG